MNTYAGERMAIQLGPSHQGPIIVTNNHFYGWQKER